MNRRKLLTSLIAMPLLSCFKEKLPETAIIDAYPDFFIDHQRGIFVSGKFLGAQCFAYTLNDKEIFLTDAHINLFMDDPHKYCSIRFDKTKCFKDSLNNEYLTFVTQDPKNNLRISIKRYDGLKGIKIKKANYGQIYLIEKLIIEK